MTTPRTRLIIAASALALLGSAVVATPSIGAVDPTVAAREAADLALVSQSIRDQFPDAVVTPTAAGLGAASSGEMRLERESRSLSTRVAWKATPDECFAGIGVDTPFASPCPAGSVPKTNQGYAWGMTAADGKLWWGTGANVQCLVSGTFLSQTTPSVNQDYTCEFGQSANSRLRGVPAGLGDMRTPVIYRYTPRTGVTTSLNASVTGLSAVRLAATVGLRAAGSTGRVVYFAGPSLPVPTYTIPGGISLFAFNAKTSAFLGSTTLASYNNIRSFVLAAGGLYAGVGNTAGGGSVLRFNPTAIDPFARTVVVSDLDGEAATITTHAGRLAVGTWPNPVGSAVASVWTSPTLGKNGLASTTASQWTKLWSAADYEPDPVVRATYGVGPVQSFNGALYWGTMHVPFVSTAAKWRTYGSPTSQEGTIADILGTYRVTSVFRFTGAVGSGTTRTLYGQPIMPVWDPTLNTGAGGWTLSPSPAGLPLLGLSGFGNPFNNYSWSSAVYGGKLYWGTMDWTTILAAGLDPTTIASIRTALETAGIPVNSLPGLGTFVGADVWRFGRTGRATPETINGFGNTKNYGIRTMATLGDNLYLGTANPMNLSAQGGAEVIRAHG